MVSTTVKSEGCIPVIISELSREGESEAPAELGAVKHRSPPTPLYTRYSSDREYTRHAGVVEDTVIVIVISRDGAVNCHVKIRRCVGVRV